MDSYEEGETGWQVLVGQHEETAGHDVEAAGDVEVVAGRTQALPPVTDLLDGAVMLEQS